jgi:hypothetical protein
VLNVFVDLLPAASTALIVTVIVALPSLRKIDLPFLVSVSVTVLGPAALNVAAVTLLMPSTFVLRLTFTLVVADARSEPASSSVAVTLSFPALISFARVDVAIFSLIVGALVSGGGGGGGTVAVVSV